MFAEVKNLLPISGDGYDEQIIIQIKAAARDLTSSTEIVLPGVISITRKWVEPVEGVLTHENDVPGHWEITDKSTIKDELVIATIATWCNMMIGNPPNVDFLQKTYKSLKGQMKLSSKYTRYDGGVQGCEC